NSHSWRMEKDYPNINNRAVRVRKTFRAIGSSSVCPSPYGGSSGGNQSRSKAPHQPNQTALNLDAVRAEDAGFVRLVGRFERNRGAAAAQPLQRDLLIVDQRDDDHTVLRGFAALDDHGIAVENTGVDHTVSGHLKSVVLAAPAQQARRHTDRGCLI